MISLGKFFAYYTAKGAFARILWRIAIGTITFMNSAASPIGVFDSGIGGLSVLQALRSELPHEHFVYLADSGNAPYGERGDAFVQQRTYVIAQWLSANFGVKALVIACNTATAAGADELRVRMPQLPLIGVEPAIKPAALASQTHGAGVMATRGTVESRRFKNLVATYGQGVDIHVQACDGLAHAIEASILEPAAVETAEVERPMSDVERLCAQYVDALGAFGVKTGEMDVLVLGCTHYIFAKEELRRLVGPDIQLIDTSHAVARQARRLLASTQQLRPEPAHAEGQQIAPESHIQLLTTGDLASLKAAAQRWLGLSGQCCSTRIIV